MNNHMLLKIFKHNINNNYKLVPFNIKLNDYRSKYEVPYSKEWKSTVYSYYKNNIKNISTNYSEINNIILSYFNFYFLPKFLYIKNMSKTRRNLLLRRIYVSNIEIKMNNNKAIITLYIINTERKRMISRYLNKEIFKKLTIFLNQLIIPLIKELYISTNNEINIKIWENYKSFLKTIDIGYTNKSWNIKEKTKFLFSIKKLILFIKKGYFIPFFYNHNDYKFNRFIWYYFFEIKYISFMQLLYNLKFKYLINESYHEIKLKSKIKELKNKFEQYKTYLLYIEKFYKKNIWLKKTDNINHPLNSYVFKIHYNNIKKYTYPYKLFVKKLDKTYSYLYKLNCFIMRILKKKIEFNIVNLKSFSYNSDIFTKSLSIKLRKKKYFSAYRAMKTIINNVKLPTINTIIERKNLKYKKDYSLVNNKYKNNNLSSNKKLLNLYFQNIQKNNKVIKFNRIIFYSLFNSIKHKNIGGLRFEIKGRLTKRYRADRALYKLNLTGGLKNIESSFNKLSSTLYRGYSKPNVTYSIFKSKRRTGAFAAKGWVSGK